VCSGRYSVSSSGPPGYGFCDRQDRSSPAVADPHRIFDVTIAVSADSGKYQLSPAAATDGSETAVAVLLQAVDATAADATGLIAARGPVIVSEAALVFDTSVDDTDKEAAKKAELVDVGIIPRTTA